MVKRPEKGLLANLWEFPTVEVSHEDTRERRREAMREYLTGKIGLAAADVRLERALSIGSPLKHVFSHIDQGPNSIAKTYWFEKLLAIPFLFSDIFKLPILSVGKYQAKCCVVFQEGFQATTFQLNRVPDAARGSAASVARAAVVRRGRREEAGDAVAGRRASGRGRRADPDEESVQGGGSGALGRGRSECLAWRQERKEEEDRLCQDGANDGKIPDQKTTTR